jgi:hypothetical protein
VDPARIYSGPCEHSCNATLTTQESIEQYLERGYSYARSNNPTVTALERKVAELEGGHAAACFGTGMAATNALMAAMLTAGDHCVITNCSYGGETQHPFHLATAPLSLGDSTPFTTFHLDVLCAELSPLSLGCLVVLSPQPIGVAVAGLMHICK